jgi:hypothetical protein
MGRDAEAFAPVLMMIEEPHGTPERRAGPYVLEVVA